MARIRGSQAKTLEQTIEHRWKKVKDENLQEGQDYVICKWDNCPEFKALGYHCNKWYKDRGGIDAYKKEFPKDVYLSEKWRKIFSDRMSGQNNISSKSKSSDLERKERSPRSLEFYLKKYPELSREECQAKLDKFSSDDHKNRPPESKPAKLEYWLSRGCTLKEAREGVKKFQSKFSKQKCIEIHGKEEGMKIFNARQKKWQTSLNDKSEEELERINKAKIPANISNLEVEFLDYLEENLHIKFKRQFPIEAKDNADNRFFYHPDAVYEDKIIEFFGDYWHGNPKKYSADSQLFHGPAYQTWESDAKRIQEFHDAGFKTLIVWEDDYRQEKETVLEKCKQFLNL